MQLEVNAEELRNAVNKILSVVDKKNSKPILTNCLIKAENNKLLFLATDLEVSAKVIINAKVEKPGEFCISAKNIFDISRELPNKDVLLTVDENQNLLRLVCGEINFSLLICKTDEYPTLNFQTHSKENFRLSGNQLLQIIGKTSHAISNDETRYNLNGIFIQEIDSKLRAVATDGHILALLEDPKYNSNNSSLENGIIIPKKGISEIKKISDNFPDEEINISVDDSFIYLSVEGKLNLSIRLITREYPKYQAVIPNKTSFQMNVEKDSLVTAVKRIKIMANEKSNAIKMAIKNNELTISANHPSLGDATEKLNVEYDGKEVEIGFNAKYLIDTFSALENEEISMEFNNEFSPIIFKSHQNPEFLGIVMPLRL